MSEVIIFLYTYISLDSSCSGISVECVNKVWMVITLSDFFLLVPAGEMNLLIVKNASFYFTSISENFSHHFIY